MRKNKFDALRKKVEEAKPKGGDAEAGNASNPGLDAIAKKIERLWGVAPSDIDRCVIIPYFTFQKFVPKLY